VLAGGTGNDTVKGGLGNDTIKFADESELTKADTVDGGDGTDAIQVSADSTLEDEDFTLVSNVETINTATVSTTAANIGITLGAKAAAAGIKTIVLGDDGAADSVTIGKDFTNDLSVTLSDDGGAGTGVRDVITANADYANALTGTGLVSDMDEGDEALTITNSIDSDFTTVNASANKGGVTVTGANTTGITFTGGSAADTITSGAGNDTIDGGAGNDIAIFSGNRSAYTINKLSNINYKVVDNRGTDGADTVLNVESLRLADQDFDITPSGLNLVEQRDVLFSSRLLEAISNPLASVFPSASNNLELNKTSLCSTRFSPDGVISKS
jgi:Ca2+-binding RTX toxin-like protein